MSLKPPKNSEMVPELLAGVDLTSLIKLANEVEMVKKCAGYTTEHTLLQFIMKKQNLGQDVILIGPQGLPSVVCDASTASSPKEVGIAYKNIESDIKQGEK